MLKNIDIKSKLSYFTYCTVFRGRMLRVLREKLGVKKYILMFFVIFLIIEFIMIFIMKDLSIKEFLELQVTTDKGKFLEILSSWSELELSAYRNHFYLDFLYLISYSLLLFSLISYYFNKAHVENRGTVFLLLPFVIAILDIIENTFHIFFIVVNNEMPKIFVMLSGVFSIQKWVLVAVVLYIIIVSFFKLTIVHQK